MTKYIENIYPSVFNKPTGIEVLPDDVHGVMGYAVQPFQIDTMRNHYADRQDQIKHLVMHYTVCPFNVTLLSATANQTSNRTSEHIIITQKEQYISSGQVIRVAEDNKVAWHAGASYWEKDSALNKSSIGIEHVNPGFIEQHNGMIKWFPFDADQIAVSCVISNNIVKKYDIEPTNVIGHQDIAHQRKSDPGILFPWQQFYENGVGAWLNDKEINDPKYINDNYDPKISAPTSVNGLQFLHLLKIYGYEIPNETTLDNTTSSSKWSQIAHNYSSVIKAFKSHFSANQQPELYNSDITINDMHWAWGLVSKYHPNEEFTNTSGDIIEFS